MTVEPIPVYILAGGHSSRFGSDKARALLDGTPMLPRIAQQISPLASRMTVVADRAGKYADLGLATIADQYPGHGPMAGLHAAMLHAQGDPWLLLLSCDIIEVRSDWILTLLSARKPDSKAVAFRHDHWEPLLALYSTRIIQQVARRIESNDLAMHRLLDDLPAVAVPLPSDWPAVSHFNTPGELNRYSPP